MRKQQRWGAVCVALLWCIGATAWGQPNAIVFRTEQAVYMRWKPADDANLEGYRVYRASTNGAWEQLTQEPLHRIKNVAEIRRRVGEYKTSVFLSLFGLGNDAAVIDDAAYSRVFASPQGAGFVRVMALLHHEFGALLGEVFVDSTAVPNSEVQYRIAAVIGSSERDVARVSVVRVGEPDAVPMVEDMEGSAQHHAALLQWARNRAALRAGAVVAYHVYRADELIGTYERVNTAPVLPASGGGDTADVQHYMDQFRENDKPVYYYATAVNAFGFESAPSPIVEVVPTDTRMPGRVSDIRASLLGTSVRLQWEYTSRVVARGFEVWRATTRTGVYNKVFTAQRNGAKLPPQQWVDIHVREGGAYFYYVRAVGAVEQRGMPSDTIAYLYPDERPPTAPRSVQVRADTGRIVLTWQRNSESDVLGYEVERAGDALLASRFLLTNTPIVDTVFVDSLPAVSQTVYGYVVYARDSAYNRSAPSPLLTVRMPDIVAPQAPLFTHIEERDTTVVLHWTRSPEQDVREYRLYRALDDSLRLVLRGVYSQPSATDIVEQQGRYYYAVRTVDSAGNESVLSEIRALDVVALPPRAPDSGSVRAKETALLVQWSTSHSGNVAGYLVQRQDAATGRVIDIAELNAEQTSFEDQYADRSRKLRYRIYARDKRWRMSSALVVEYVPE